MCWLRSAGAVIERAANVSEADNYDELLMGYEFFLNLMRHHGQTVEQAKATIRRMFGDVLAARVTEYWDQLVNDEIRRIGGAAVVRGLGAAEPWYPGPLAADRYWPALRNHLLNHPSTPWKEKDVDRLDTASSIVLASCQSPWKEASSGRGLVVGHVQSGKTTNFTAVMAKAADAGFRLFIVLSGTTKSLRRQTQQRLEEQLRELNPHAWYFHTTIDGDIGRATNWVPFLNHQAIRTCIVVKKNKRRLQNLNRCLDEAGRLGILADCATLVIDDEGDNASLSPNCDPAKTNAINRQIVKAISRPRVTYVAYTATPFANCFVDPSYDDNLFPRDFIYGLPEPESYFGSRRLHGSGGDDDVQAVIDIPDEEVDEYFDEPIGDVPSLVRSVQWFLLAATARRIRNGGVQPHSTMLINLSERTEVHRKYWFVVRDIVRDISDRLVAGDSALDEELESLWAAEADLVDPARFGVEKVPFEGVRAGLLATVAALGPLDGRDHNAEPDCGIVVDNSVSAYRLAYNDAAPRPVIVVGGNTLSRGLTLEGLISTVFLRSTRLYDTLLQMGRWFGYRRGYEDLFRVWMPRETRERFEFLARIEIELRDWIDLFARTGKTPLELGPRFRAHPQMQITRAALMKRVRVERLDLSGTQPETSYFENTAAAVARHHAAVVALASDVADCPDEQKADGHLFRNVPGSAIARFFDEGSGFSVVGHSYLTNRTFLDYVAKKRAHGELEEWNVLFRKKTGGAPVPFLPGVGASLVNRSRKSSIGDFVDIGSLADSGDKRADVPAAQKDTWVQYRALHPLLVIYVIDKDSTADARARRNNRADLDAVDHLVGVALFIPQSTHDDDFGTFVCPQGPWDQVPSDAADDEPNPDDDDEQDAAQSLPVVS